MCTDALFDDRSLLFYFVFVCLQYDSRPLGSRLPPHRTLQTFHTQSQSTLVPFRTSYKAQVSTLHSISLLLLHTTSLHHHPPLCLLRALLQSIHPRRRRRRRQQVHLKSPDLHRPDLHHQRAGQTISVVDRERLDGRVPRGGGTGEGLAGGGGPGEAAQLFGSLVRGVLDVCVYM